MKTEEINIPFLKKKLLIEYEGENDNVIKKIILEKSHQKKQTIEKEINFIQGVKVPKFITETPPEKLDPLLILKERNIQRRAVYIQLIGMDRLLAKVEHKIIDRDGSNQLVYIKNPYLKEKNRKLPEIPEGLTEWQTDNFKEREQNRIEQRDIMLLVVRCPSTDVFYTLRVPSTMKTAEEARKWTFQMEKTDVFVKEA